MSKREYKESVLKAFWVVFGYSFVGFISLFYGLSLQAYNYNTDKYVYENILDVMKAEGSSFSYAYIMYLVIIILYTLLFCHAYASIYVGKVSKSERALYHKLGHWMETVLLIVLIYVVSRVGGDGIIGNNAIGTLILISIPWWVCIISYRSFLRHAKDKKGNKLSKRLKYRLTIPAILLVAVNIYSGSCILEMWENEEQYCIMFMPLVLFISIYCLMDYYIEMLRKKRNFETDDKEEVFFDKILVVYFGILLILAGLIVYTKRYWSWNAFYTPIKTLFLASFVAIYLFMFEGWFLLRHRGEKSKNGKKKKKETSDNEKIEKAINAILKIMPIIVFILFPFQAFELVYYVSFIVGHIMAWIYWDYYYYKRQKSAPKLMAIMRALFGVLTLVALIADKLVQLSCKEYVGKAIDVGVLMEKSFVIGLLEVGIGVLAILLPYKRKAQIAFNNIRIVVYVLISLILTLFYPAIKGLEEDVERVFLSIVGCMIFIAFELYLCLCRKEEKYNEAQGEITL